METGEADIDNNGVISYTDLYNYAYEHVSNETSMQKPGMWVFGLEGDVVIAKSRRKQKDKKEQDDGEQLDDKEASEYNDKSLLKLLQDEKIREFNIIRKNKEDILSLRFRKADLSTRNLGGVDLHDADLTQANLNNAKLKDAILRGATLKAVNLSHADLRGADLYGSNLASANLSHADLRGADLRGTIDFTDANLTGANMKAVDLDGIVNFDGTILHDVDFTGSITDKVMINFKGADIKNAKGLPSLTRKEQEANRYTESLKSFSESISRQFKSNNISAEQLKPIEEGIKDLAEEIKDINEGEENEIIERKRLNIRTKLIALLEKVMDTIPQPGEQTHNVFDSLKSFEKLIGEEFQPIIQNITLKKEKEETAMVDMVEGICSIKSIS